MKWYLIMVLIGILLMTNDIEHLFMHFLDICISSLETCLLRFFVPFLMGCLIDKLLRVFKKIYSEYYTLTGYMISYSMDCLLTFLIVSSEVQKFLILMKSNLSIFLFFACAFGVISMEPLSNPRSQKLYLFSSNNFTVLSLRSLIHFELIFVYGVK